jgi:hypothetical protein
MCKSMVVADTYYADFTLLEYGNNSALHVSQTWIGGKQIN